VPDGKERKGLPALGDALPGYSLKEEKSVGGFKADF
jgi:hypothetical protein